MADTCARKTSRRPHAHGVELFVPPKPARQAEKKGRELEPRGGDTEAVQGWNRRMASEEGKEIYKAAGGDQRNRQRGSAQLSRADTVPSARLGEDQVRSAVVRAGIQRDALRCNAAELNRAASADRPSAANRCNENRAENPAELNPRSAPAGRSRSQELSHNTKN